MPPSVESMPQQPGGPIERDLPCRKCGYNLRGLSPDGRCPECGTAVGYSLQGDLLRYMNPDWVRTLASGARMTVVGIFAILLGSLLPGWSHSAELEALVAVAGWALALVGWWRLARPDPSGLGEDRYGASRKLIRLCVIIAATGEALQTALGTAHSLPVIMLLGPVRLLTGITVVVGLLAQLSYLRMLARRIPDIELVARAYFLRNAFGIAFAVALVFGMLSRLLQPGSSEFATATACVMIPIALALLLFTSIYLFLLLKLGERFREQAQIARWNWPGHGTPPPNLPTI